MITCPVSLGLDVNRSYLASGWRPKAIQRLSFTSIQTDSFVIRWSRPGIQLPEPEDLNANYWWARFVVRSIQIRSFTSAIFLVYMVVKANEHVYTH